MGQDVAIVTGGSVGTGRAVARALGSRGWAIVVVYLEDQGTALAAVTEIEADRSLVVAVRADLGDDLDVKRLFAEANAVFGEVDVLVHTSGEPALVLYRHAATRISAGGLIMAVATDDRPADVVARRLREREITFAIVTSRDEALALSERWRQPR